MLVCEDVLVCLQAEKKIEKREVDKQRRESEAGSLGLGGSWRWKTDLGEELQDSDDSDAAAEAILAQQIPSVASYQMAGNRQSLARYAAREISSSPLLTLKRATSGLQQQGSLLRHLSATRSISEASASALPGHVPKVCLSERQGV